MEEENPIRIENNSPQDWNNNVLIMQATLDK